MKDSEILKLARKKIVEKEEDFICHALDQLLIVNHQQITLLKEWIAKMLGHYDTYGGWANAVFIDRMRPISDQKWDKITREGRLAWLDWMIAYCEERGL